VQLAFELQPAAELRVRVLDARNETPLEAHLILETADGAYLPIRPHRTADGETFLFSLAPGEYRLTAVVHGYANKKVALSAPGVVEVRME
jgi:hypothetical protein